MSSLAAARADGYYRSKNFDPAKFVAKKSDVAYDKPFVVVEGQRIGGSKVRYETPFHVRCQGCQNMVAKGVRFNSIKTWVGNFHSTQIFMFRMKCPQCPQRFVVKTDPENCEYIYESGAKRIFQTKDCTDQSRIRDEKIQKKIRQNPFAKIENDFKDKVAFQGFNEHIEKLTEMKERGEHDYEMNRLLRKHARVLREEQKEYFAEKASKNLQIPLLPETIEDLVQAEGIQFKQEKKKIIKKEDKKMTERDRLKQKMKKLNPHFRDQLQQQIRHMNKPTSLLPSKK